MITIKHRFTGEVLFSSLIKDVNTALDFAIHHKVDLAFADPSSPSLAPIRDDLWNLLSCFPQEVPAVRNALLEGRIDGRSYKEDGNCSCIIGTIARARNCNVRALRLLKPNAHIRPIERLIQFGILPGDTPATNTIAMLVLEWIDEWRSIVNQQQYNARTVEDTALVA